MVDPNAFTPVRDIKIYKILSVTHDTSLFDLLNTFQEGACHMTVVTENVNGQSIATGVVTLEDVIEELIQEEIIDETDVYSDVVTRTKVTRALNLAGIKRISKSRVNSTGVTPGSLGKDTETTPLKQQDKRLLAVQQDQLRQLGSATPDPCTRRAKLFTTPKEETDPLKFTRFTSFQNAKERQHLRPFAEADRENESGSDHSFFPGSL
jgi:metal transporter CNNM